MFSFIVSAVLSVGAIALRILITVGRSQEEKNPTDHFEDASWWDIATGKPFREAQRDMETGQQMVYWAGCCFAFGVASGLFAIVKATVLRGG